MPVSFIDTNVLVYLASSAVNLSMAQERSPDVKFLDTKAHAVAQG